MSLLKVYKRNYYILFEWQLMDIQCYLKAETWAFMKCEMVGKETRQHGGIEESVI